MFDGYARRAALRASQDQPGASRRGVSRRHVIAGAAWSAPVLAATMAGPAWGAGESTGGLGQSCGNQGQGTCNQPFKCNGNRNQCNNCFEPNICGGEGASCCATTQCDPQFGLVCTPQTSTPGFQFCRRPCTGDAGCATGQVCGPDGLCAEPCTRNSQCLGGAVC
ncbi:MAG: hypothetical protein M3519_06085, partial [Actinomycetota bacterium]|nr:hypothetical protein [Actinomycetota bacterium]